MSKTYKWRGLKSTAFGENQKVQLNFERISENKYKPRDLARQLLEIYDRGAQAVLPDRNCAGK